MTITAIRHYPTKRRFMYFIEAREDARYGKEVVGGKPPYSTDPIIAQYRFCNINREDDTVTKWIAQHVRSRELTRTEMVTSLAIARIYNEPNTLKCILPYQSLELSKATLELLRKDGEKLMRGAYMTGAHGTKNKGVNVIDYYHKAFVEIEKLPWLLCDSLASVAERLVQVEGMGSFFANQICTDLRYTEHYADAPDWSTFILCGPGTRRGIDRWDGLKNPKGGRTQSYYCTKLLEIREELRKTFDHEAVEYFRDPNNLANSFCEWDKYERVLWATKKNPVSLRRNYP